MQKFTSKMDGHAVETSVTLPQTRGVELSWVPPVAVDADAIEERYERLARVTAEYAVPRLLALHTKVASPPGFDSADRNTDIHELARLVLGPDGEAAAGFLYRLKDSGLSLDVLHSELLGPTASYLGELWDTDKIDFVDVTLGVARLQRLVIHFEGLDQVLDSEDKRKILIVGAPGEHHSLGHTIIQRFFRASGWQVWSCITPHMEEVARVTAEDWYGVVGFSLSLDTHFDGLRDAISKIRSGSLNRSIGIIVGGSAIARNPDWVGKLDADGTAVNGPSAVVLAKALLATAARRSVEP